MLVETFECEETRDETPELADEAVALIEQLGLTGQRGLVNKSRDRVARFPYRQMTEDEQFVYRTICPRSTDLSKYADGPIPLRVLQVAAHAVDFFDGIKVWHRTSVSIKDPVLVGEKKDGVNHWQTHLYILARWGEALDEWPAMLKQAMGIWRDRFRSAAQEKLREAKADLEVVDEADVAFAMKHAPSF